MKRFFWGVIVGIVITLTIAIIGISVIHFKKQPEVTSSEATASATKQLQLIVGPDAYSQYKKNWVIQTYLQWYNKGDTIGSLLSSKRIYVVNINLTMDSNATLPSRDFEFLVNAKNGNTFSALEYSVSEHHDYKIPF